MGRRDIGDTVVTEYVKERLAQLLAEQRPRRAQQAPDSGRSQAAAQWQRPDQRMPQSAPADDDEGLDLLSSGGQGEAVPPQRGVEELSAGPETVAALRFSRAHLNVVVALLVIGLLWAGWSVMRAKPVAMANPVGAPSVSSPTASSPARTPRAAPPSAPAQIMVHVLGAVRKPGVVLLPERARVRDALAATGGLTRQAAPGDLNLAQVLQDGQQIVIGTERRPSGEVRSSSSGDSTGGAAGRAGGSAGADGGAAGVVDLNRATEVQLEGLPGVGPVTAGKIVAWRSEHGRFTRIEELQEVDGIGPKTYAEIAPHVRV